MLEYVVSKCNLVALSFIPIDAHVGNWTLNSISVGPIPLSPPSRLPSRLLGSDPSTSSPLAAAALKSYGIPPPLITRIELPGYVLVGGDPARFSNSWIFLAGSVLRTLRLLQRYSTLSVTNTFILWHCTFAKGVSLKAIGTCDPRGNDLPDITIS